MHWIEILGLALVGIILIPILIAAVCFLAYEAYGGIKNFSLRQKFREASAYLKRLREDRIEQVGLLIMAIVVTGLACMAIGPAFRTPIPEEPLKPIVATEIPNTDGFVRDKVIVMERWEDLVAKGEVPADADRKMNESHLHAWKALQSAPMFCTAEEEGLQIKRIGGVVTTVPWDVVRAYFYQAEDRDWVPEFKPESVEATTDG